MSYQDYAYARDQARAALNRQRLRGMTPAMAIAAAGVYSRLALAAAIRGDDEPDDDPLIVDDRDIGPDADAAYAQSVDEQLGVVP